MPANPLLLDEAIAELKGRGARSNAASRFHEAHAELDRDYLESLRHNDEALSGKAGSSGTAPPLPPRGVVETKITVQRARSIISRNESPDVPFDRSVNPYQGCEHGCVYCYARPSHAYLGLSPGLDFETRIFAKDNAAEQLDRELRKPGYAPALLALGANTDPYQPIERSMRITRRVLETLSAFNHPVGITTKSHLVTRDIDILRDMAQRKLAQVWVSIGSLDADIARTLEPRASAPHRRLEAIRALARADIPVGVIVGPVIPALTDPHMESVLAESARAGASFASYVVLRLPLEVRDLFVEWLQEFHPLRLEHVMSQVRGYRNGKENDPRFGARMKGSGVLGEMLRQRFGIACRRAGLERHGPPLDRTRFRVPQPRSAQASLFD